MIHAFNHFGVPRAPRKILIPVNASVPVITGTAQVDEVLSASRGSWLHQPTSYAFQWYADDVAIEGATDETYTPVVGQIGAVLHVGVTATNAAGSSSQAVSADTDPVIAA